MRIPALVQKALRATQSLGTFKQHWINFEWAMFRWTKRCSVFSLHGRSIADLLIYLLQLNQVSCLLNFNPQIRKKCLGNASRLFAGDRPNKLRAMFRSKLARANSVISAEGISEQLNGPRFAHLNGNVATITSPCRALHNTDAALAVYDPRKIRQNNRIGAQDMGFTLFVTNGPLRFFTQKPSRIAFFSCAHQINGIWNSCALKVLSVPLTFQGAA